MSITWSSLVTWCDPIRPSLPSLASALLRSSLIALSLHAFLPPLPIHADVTSRPTHFTWVCYGPVRPPYVRPPCVRPLYVRSLYVRPLYVRPPCVRPRVSGPCMSDPVRYSVRSRRPGRSVVTAPSAVVDLCAVVAPDGRRVH